jgi:NTE family protein
VRQVSTLIRGDDKGIADRVLLTNKPIQGFLEQYCSKGKLYEGIPLYVSLYREDCPADGLVGVLLSELKLTEDTTPPNFIDIQSLPNPTEQIKAILASAAIPIAYDAQVIDGKRYSDGGQASWANQMGNVPTQPLYTKRFRNFVIVHMKTESIEPENLFRTKKNVVEIHPKRQIVSQNKLPDIFQFNDGEYINELIRQGYLDASEALDESNEYAF